MDDVSPSGSASPPPMPGWVSLVRVLLRILQVVVVVGAGLATKALIRQNGPMAGLVIVAGILLLVFISFVVRKGLAVLVADAHRPQPSRGLGIVKIVIGLVLAGVCLWGIDPELPFGLLPYGYAGPLLALAFAVPIALGLHLLVMGSLAQAGSRPPVWLRFIVFAGIVAALALAGPQLSASYRTGQVAAGKLPVYTSPFGSGEFFAFINDGKDLAVVEDSGTLSVWHQGASKEAVRSSHSKLWRAVFSPNRKLMAWTAGGARYGVYDIAAKKDILSFEGQADAIAISHDSRRLVVSTTKPSKAVEVYEIQEGAKPAQYQVADVQQIQCIGFHPDGQRLFCGDVDGDVVVFNTQNSEQKNLFKAPDKLFKLDVSPDGKRLALGGSFAGVYVVDAETGKQITLFQGHSKDFTHRVQFSRDSRLVCSVAGLSEGEGILWEADTGRELYRRPIDSTDITCDLSDDGKLLALPASYYIKVWDVSRYTRP